MHCCEEFNKIEHEVRNGITNLSYLIGKMQGCSLDTVNLKEKAHAEILRIELSLKNHRCDYGKETKT